MTSTVLARVRSLLRLPAEYEQLEARIDSLGTEIHALRHDLQRLLPASPPPQPPPPPIPLLGPLNRPGVWAIGASVLLFVAAGAMATITRGYLIGAGLAFLGSLTLLIIPLRGPRLRVGVVLWGAAVSLLVLEFTIAATPAVQFAYIDELPDDPAQLALAVGFLGWTVCAVGYLALTWLPGRPYVEAAALGILSLAVGSLGVWWLHAASAVVEPPRIHGAVTVFFAADEPEPHTLYLNAHLIPDPKIATNEIISIVNPDGNQPVRWVLLLTGDARLSSSAGSIRTSPAASTVKEFATSGDGTYGPTEFLSGTLNGGATQEISGPTSAIYVQSTAARAHSVGSLPLYEIGSRGTPYPDPIQQALQAQIGAYAWQPSSRNGEFEVDVWAGPLDRLDEQVEADPPLNDPHVLEWTAPEHVAPTYAIDSRRGEAVLNTLNVLVGILFGVAGSGLVAAVQKAFNLAASWDATNR